MKKRAASSLLAILAVVSLILPALAAASADPPAVEEPFPEVSQEIEEVQNAICLDGEPVFTVEYEIRDGVCYATVNSFVSMMDAEAMVEEEDGVVRVNASAVVEVVEIPAQGESMSEEFQKTVEAAQMQAAEDGLWMTPDETQQPVDGMGEEDPVPAVTDAPVAANVVMDDLNMVAVEGEQYLVANDRYLYAGDGLIEINGCVAAPIRVLAKVFNVNVDFDAENDVVVLTRQPGAQPYLDPRWELTLIHN